MRVLVLTSINPVIATTVYSTLSEEFKTNKPKIHYLCFPFFAEMECMLHGKEYVPAFFAMLKVSMKKDMNRKLYDKKNMIVVGNTYKDQKFDIVVAFDDMRAEVFDSYIETIKTEAELEEFRKKIDIQNLYSLEDADIRLPTMEHLKLFIREVFNEKNDAKQ